VFAVALAVLAAAGGGIYHFTRGRDAAVPGGAVDSAAVPKKPRILPRLSASRRGQRLPGRAPRETAPVWKRRRGSTRSALRSPGMREWEAQVDLTQGRKSARRGAGAQCRSRFTHRDSEEASGPPAL
jgi:hypothetical protein